MGSRRRLGWISGWLLEERPKKVEVKSSKAEAGNSRVSPGVSKRSSGWPDGLGGPEVKLDAQEIRDAGARSKNGCWHFVNCSGMSSRLSRTRGQLGIAHQSNCE